MRKVAVILTLIWITSTAYGYVRPASLFDMITASKDSHEEFLLANAGCSVAVDGVVQDVDAVSVANMVYLDVRPINATLLQWVSLGVGAFAVDRFAECRFSDDRALHRGLVGRRVRIEGTISNERPVYGALVLSDCRFVE